MDKHNNGINPNQEDNFEKTQRFDIDEIKREALSETETDASSSRKGKFDSFSVFDSSSKEPVFEDTVDDLIANSIPSEDFYDSPFNLNDNSSYDEPAKHTPPPPPSGEPDKSGKKRKKKNEFFDSTAWFVIKTLLLFFAATFLICAIAFTSYMFSLDDEIDIEIEALRLDYSSIVYYVDENGVEHEYERLYNSQNRTWVNLEDMPEHLKNAAVAIEDHRFWEHNGVDWKRTLSASVNMFFKMKSDFGASTITQQLVKNLTGDNQDSVKRKLQEIMRALYLEDHYDKETILELYLNTIFLGEGCYGVGTAAQTYFGKDVSELTLAESAAIIGITNLPTYYNPYLHPENNKKRCQNIINRMYELDMISKDERDSALSEELVFSSKNGEDGSGNVQSYFVDQIIEELLVDLTEECGYSKSVALHLIYSGGLKIYATVDPEIQSQMDVVFEDSSNFRKFNSAVQPECAMVLMDPQNGNVVALRGGRGEKVGARILNRATQTKRPPGSTIKPISVYAPAIEYGLITPFSVEDDAPVIFFKDESSKNAAGLSSQDNISVAINQGQAGKLYPNNENKQFSGRTNILEAVKQSINTVSMRTLNKLGTDKAYNFLTANLGMTSLVERSDKNLAPLSLGQLTNGASVLEMAAAYVPFANGGSYYEPKLYTKVVDNNGNVLIDKKTKPVKAMSEKTATYMSYMLQNVITDGTGTKAKLERGMPAAAKTGTSTRNEDRWFVGYTPYYVGATWFGYDNPSSLGETLSQALTTWKKVMDKVHADLPVKNFAQNSDFEYVNICSKSGLLPNEHCYNDPRGSQIIAGYFHKDDLPTKQCDVHVSVVVDTSTNMLSSKFCPSENKATVVRMSLNRYLNLPDVVLADEQYVIHSGDLPDGMFRFVAQGGNALNPNKICTTHTEAQEKENEEEDFSDENDPFLIPDEEFYEEESFDESSNNDDASYEEDSNNYSGE